MGSPSKQITYYVANVRSNWMVEVQEWYHFIKPARWNDKQIQWNRFSTPILFALPRILYTRSFIFHLKPLISCLRVVGTETEGAFEGQKLFQEALL